MREKNIVQVPPDFNWKMYLELNPDIAKYPHYSTQQGSLVHWKQYGFSEGRPYKNDQISITNVPKIILEVSNEEVINEKLVNLNNDPNKLLTVVIPNKFGQKPGLTINSLYEQTFTNFDIITINDTVGNANAARNRGLKLVKTPYVLFSDNDIIWEKNALENMMIYLVENPEISLVFGNWECNGKIKSTMDWCVDELIKNNYISMMSIVRTEHHPGFDDEIKRFQDWDVWLNMIKENRIGKNIGKKIFTTPFRSDGITENSINALEGITIIKKKHFIKNLKEKIIIIPVHNQIEYLKICVDSIIENTNDFALIIVNDGSTDVDTINWLHENNKKYIILSNETPMGFSVACNMGIDYAMDNFDFNCLCLLNSDAEIKTVNWFDKVESVFISDPKVGISGIVSNNAIHQSILNVPKYLNEIDQKPTLDTVLVHGFCFFIGKNLINTIGRFDDDKFPHYGSEDDYALKSIKYGFKNVIVGSVFAYHEGQRSYTPKLRETMVTKTLPDLKIRWGNKYIDECVKHSISIQKILNN